MKSLLGIILVAVAGFAMANGGPASTIVAPKPNPNVVRPACPNPNNMSCPGYGQGKGQGYGKGNPNPGTCVRTGQSAVAGQCPRMQTPPPAK